MYRFLSKAVLSRSVHCTALFGRKVYIETHRDHRVQTRSHTASLAQRSVPFYPSHSREVSVFIYLFPDSAHCAARGARCLRGAPAPASPQSTLESRPGGTRVSADVPCYRVLIYPPAPARYAARQCAAPGRALPRKHPLPLGRPRRPRAAAKPAHSSCPVLRARRRSRGRKTRSG